jgi:hypothetical protein
MRSQKKWQEVNVVVAPHIAIGKIPLDLSVICAQIFTSHDLHNNAFLCFSFHNFTSGFD